MAFYGKKIILADPSEKDIIWLQNALQKNGARVRFCPNGAVASWYAKLESCDLVISEVKLPVVDGIKTLSRLRRFKGTKSIPFLFFTELLDHDSFEKIEKLGSCYLLQKPASLETIVSRIDELIGEVIKEPFIDRNLVKIFVASLREIMNHYFGEKCYVGKPKPKYPTILESGVLGSLHFGRAGIRGSMNIFFSPDFLQFFSDKLFGENEELSPEIECDLAGELCNQISGVTKENCKAASHSIQMSLPKIIHATESQEKALSHEPVLSIPISLGNSSCYIDFYFEKVG